MAGNTKKKGKGKGKGMAKKKKALTGSDLLGAGLAKKGANTLRSALARRKAILDNL